MKMQRKTANLLGVSVLGAFGLLVLSVMVVNEFRERKALRQAESLAELFASRNAETITAWNNRQLRDPWGTEVEYEDVDEKVRVTSAGPDRALKTADDISSKWHGKKSRLFRDAPKPRESDEAEPEPEPVAEPESKESFWGGLKSKFDKWRSSE